MKYQIRKLDVGEVLFEGAVFSGGAEYEASR